MFEHAFNSAQSEITGYTPFFLNSGQMPHSMIWDEASPYPGVRVFAQRMKNAVMAAHNAILATRVEQVYQTNHHCKPVPFVEGDLVYLSTKNLSLPKKCARKLMPKFLGPFKILHNYRNGSFLKQDLQADLKQRGNHPTFHASLLQIHIPDKTIVFQAACLHRSSTLVNRL